jgi:hypothetical protein
LEGGDSSQSASLPIAFANHPLPSSSLPPSWPLSSRNAGEGRSYEPAVDDGGAPLELELLVEEDELGEEVASSLEVEEDDAEDSSEVGLYEEKVEEA